MKREAPLHREVACRSKDCQRRVVDRSGRPGRIVVNPPSLDLLDGFLQRAEQALVQAFVAQLAVEGFYERALRRLAPPLDDLVQRCHQMPPLDRSIRHPRQARILEVIDHRQDRERPPRREMVGHEVERPVLVRALWQRPRGSNADDAALHLQILLAIQSPKALVIHPHTLPFEWPAQSTIAERPSLSRQGTHPGAQIAIVQPHRPIPKVRPVHLQKPAGAAPQASDVFLDDVLQISASQVKDRQLAVSAWRSHARAS